MQISPHPLRQSVSLFSYHILYKKMFVDGLTKSHLKIGKPTLNFFLLLVLLHFTCHCFEIENCQGTLIRTALCMRRGMGFN